MATLFAWQFAGALPYVGTGENVLTRFVGGSHFTLGFTLFVLVVLRWAWGLANLVRRPPPRGRLGRAAVAGDLLIYAPMMVVPGLPLKRPYGSIKPFRPYGIRSCEGATRGSPGWSSPATCSIVGSPSRCSRWWTATRVLPSFTRSSGTRTCRRGWAEARGRPLSRSSR